MNSKSLTKRRRVFQVYGLGYPYTQSYCWRELEPNIDFLLGWELFPECGHTYLYTIDWPPIAEFAVRVGVL